MFRLRENEDGGEGLKSSLYENYVIPDLRRGWRILDFGAGQCDYARTLRKAGYATFPVEFFFRKGKNIDVSTVHTMIDMIARDIRKNGLFDAVVCDSVLNSVDTVEAEQDVLTCINALCRPGGRIYFSGRRQEFNEENARSTLRRDRRRYIEFLDEDGFSAMFREGNWFYQKFHSRKQAEALALRYIGPDSHYGSIRASGWQIAGTKSVELPESQVAASLMREFNLPLPGGRTVGRGDQMLAAWQLARSATAQTASSGTK
jgi:ParB family chromosome partitioning protein